MAHQIVIQRKPGRGDPHGDSIKDDIERFLDVPGINEVRKSKVILIDSGKITPEHVPKIAESLTDKVLEEWNGMPSNDADYGIHVAFGKGVTDDPGRTAREFVLPNIFPDIEFSKEDTVHTSALYLMKTGPGVTRETMQMIAKELLANELIETIHVYTKEELSDFRPEPPKITAKHVPQPIVVDLLNATDEQLVDISVKGELSMTLEEMKAMRDHFKRPEVRERRTSLGLPLNPTQTETEVISQTWSEHCKHKIFNADIEYTDMTTGETRTISSLFRTYVERATRDIEKAKPEGWLVSVFEDNAGVVRFNNRLNLVYKVETHNSPSALDPYGGAMTGIVGVNRDPFGTGRGAGLIINVWGYCMGNPDTAADLVPKGMMHPRRIRAGVHHGIIDGGNQSGLPYGVGWEYFHEKFRGKPLVFCGTLALAPNKVCGQPFEEKIIKPGYYVVMAGGRIGKDGIHGATFSSLELHADSPTQAVQIGSPLTQKMMTDLLLEARDKGLYTGLTDNGAGGLSSSVGELCRRSGGADIDVGKAPLKYENLETWEITISEAQERMTLGVPPEKLEEFLALARKRRVEATVLGPFNDTGYFQVRHNRRLFADLDLKFLHEGYPQKKLKAVWEPPRWDEPKAEDHPTDINSFFIGMLASWNLCSIEKNARRYDHEVKGKTVVKPFIGKNADVMSPGTVFLAEHGGVEGIVLSSACNPNLSEIDTYWMTASVIDESVRGILCAGGRLDSIACLDNFCWPDPEQSKKTPDGHYKLAQLVRANQAVYDFTRAFNAPPISGKDSMKNDCTRGVDKKISVQPTLLWSAVSKINDVRDAVTAGVKLAGDRIFVFGTTYTAEIGGSQYLRVLGEKTRGKEYVGNNAPKLDAEEANRLYDALEEARDEGLFHSLHTPKKGGLGICLAYKAFAGELGIDVDLDNAPREGDFVQGLLFAESNARVVATLPEKNIARLKEIMELHGVSRFADIGAVTDTGSIVARYKGQEVLNLDIAYSKGEWKEPLRRV